MQKEHSARDRNVGKRPLKTQAKTTRENRV